jgi:hypothetical protein
MNHSPFDLANPSQGLFHPLGLPIELFLIRPMLPLAAAAGLVRGTTGFHPFRGRLFHFKQMGTSQIFLYRRNLGLYPFPRQGSGNEDGHSLVTSYPITLVAHSTDFYLYRFASLHD